MLEAIVHGRIVDLEGRPISGARVLVRTAEEILVEPISVTRAVTDEAGCYRAVLAWRRPPSVAAQIEVRARGYLVAWRGQDEDDKLELVAGAELEASFQLPPGCSYDLRVTDLDGVPVQGAVIQLHRGVGSDYEHPFLLLCWSYFSADLDAQWSTDHEGRLVVDGIASPESLALDRRYSIGVWHPEFAPNVVFDVPEPIDGVARVDIVLHTGVRVRGRVTHEGVPVAGASVCAMPRDTEAPALAAPCQQPWWLIAAILCMHPPRGTTDANGEFVLGGLDPDAEYDLMVTSPGLRLRWLTFSRPPRDLDIPLVRGASCRGLLLDRDGSPVAGEEVSTCWVGAMAVNARTDVEGRFLLEGLVNDELLITGLAKDLGYARGRDEVVIDSRETAKIRCTLVGRDDVSTDAVHLYYVDPVGNPLWNLVMWWGNVLELEAPTGDIRILVGVPGHYGGEAAVSLVAGEERAVEVVLAPLIETRIWVRDLDGNGIAGAEFRMGDMSARADARGFGKLMLWPGSMRVTACGPGFLPETQTVHVPDPRLCIEFRLRPDV